MTSKNTKSTANNSSNSEELSITTIQEATTTSISGTSTIGFEIGISDSGDVHLRIASNSGSGYFSKAWIAFTDIQDALEAWEKNHPLTSLALKNVYPPFTSINSYGFMLGILVKVGVIEPAENKRHFQLCDPARFLASVEDWKAQHSGTGKGKPKAKAKAGTRMRKAKAKPATDK